MFDGGSLGGYGAVVVWWCQAEVAGVGCGVAVH